MTFSADDLDESKARQIEKFEQLTDAFKTLGARGEELCCPCCGEVWHYA